MTRPKSQSILKAAKTAKNWRKTGFSLSARILTLERIRDRGNSLIFGNPNVQTSFSTIISPRTWMNESETFLNSKSEVILLVFIYNWVNLSQPPSKHKTLCVENKKILPFKIICVKRTRLNCISLMQNSGSSVIGFYLVASNLVRFPTKRKLYYYVLARLEWSFYLNSLDLSLAAPKIRKIQISRFLRFVLE